MKALILIKTFFIVMIFSGATFAQTEADVVKEVLTTIQEQMSKIQVKKSEILESEDLSEAEKEFILAELEATTANLLNFSANIFDSINSKFTKIKQQVLLLIKCKFFQFVGVYIFSDFIDDSWKTEVQS